MKYWHFFWGPEGRALTIIAAASRAKAVREFSRQYPQHYRYKGEWYVVQG